MRLGKHSFHEPIHDDIAYIYIIQVQRRPFKYIGNPRGSALAIRLLINPVYINYYYYVRTRPLITTYPKCAQLCIVLCVLMRHIYYKRVEGICIGVIYCSFFSRVSRFFFYLQTPADDRSIYIKCNTHLRNIIRLENYIIMLQKIE